MSRVAELAVALGVAAMILALAVVVGFKRELTRRLAGIVAPVEVTDLRSGASGAVPLRRSEDLERTIRSVEGFGALWPYAVKEGIVRTSDAVEGVLLRGMDATGDWSFFAETLVAGRLPRVSDSVRSKELLLPQRLAERLEVTPGDRIEILFVDASAAPRRDRFRVSGIYTPGMASPDGALLLADLRDVQRLADWSDDEVSGYGIAVRDLRETADFVRRLSHALLREAPDDGSYPVAADLGELYPHIFGWLRTHDVNAAVIVGVMFVVAFFNMASALMILVLERMRTIGLLRALGMSVAVVQRVFLWRAAFIALRGMAWGNVAGLGLCLVQSCFHPLRLDAGAYLLAEVPVAVEWGWWLPLNVGVLAAIVLLLTLPARLVATVKPSETIRYER